MIVAPPPSQPPPTPYKCSPTGPPLPEVTAVSDPVEEKAPGTGEGVGHSSCINNKGQLKSKVIT